MKMGRAGWFVLTVVVGVGLGLTVLALPEGWAQGCGSVSVGAAGDEPVSVEGEAVVGIAPEGGGVGIQDLTGSGVETTDCYQEDKAQTLCFAVHNGSTDGEWIERIVLTMPDDPSSAVPAWSVDACSHQDPQDSVGYPVDFDCTISGKEVIYEDRSGGAPGVSPGASWQTCVDVSVPAGYSGPRQVAWSLAGNRPTPDTENGHTEVEQCTPLRLQPSELSIEGCNGVRQALEFSLENYGAGNDADVLLEYEAPGAAFSGPTNLTISEGGAVTFTAELAPQLCLEPGEQVVARLTAGIGENVIDRSTITQTISETAGWQRGDDSPIPSMDNVVVWAAHEDGGLWSIGGYGSGGAAQRYDPESGAWVTYTAPFTPVIEYPMDGCYGLNDRGEEIVVLFPDTVVTDTLQVFNITTRQWGTRSVPGFFPGDYIGHWGFDVVSLLNNPAVRPGIADQNVCYLSGGSHQNPGGGTTRNLWRYEPATNGGQHVGDFPASVWFGFHASWYVPWIGDDGGVCVAGGVDHNSQVTDVTQCYDIGAGTFNSPNADLGPLPEPWWGMADGWQMTEHGYELWMANGVAGNGTLLPASAYFREGRSGFEYGPPVPEPLYRLEGDGYEGAFFALNGARGGFSTTQLSFHLEACPVCHRIFLPLTLRN
jgi:hypothetical protein